MHCLLFTPQHVMKCSKENHLRSTKLHQYNKKFQKVEQFKQTF